METRARSTAEQFLTLLTFMERHGDIGRPQDGIQGRLKADRLWLQLRELLNSTSGGVKKSIDKWKSVWACWKAKTKKKAALLGHKSSNITNSLTTFELRLLGIMGLSSIVDQARVESIGFDDGPSQTVSESPQIEDSIRNEFQLQLIGTDETVLDFIPIHSIKHVTTSTAPIKKSPSGDSPPPVSTHSPAPTQVSVSSATSPTPSKSRDVPRKRWRRPSTPSSTISSRASTPRKHSSRQSPMTKQRTQTPLERITSEFVAIEKRRLRMEEDREIRHHRREMRRLRLESRRIIMEENRSNVLDRLSNILDNLTKVLPKLRQSMP